MGPAAIARPEDLRCRALAIAQRNSAAETNLAAKGYTPAAGDAIQAGISAKDAILTALTGATSKGTEHATAARELRHALATRPEAAGSEKHMRELIAAKGDVEYGTDLVTATKPNLSCSGPARS